MVQKTCFSLKEKAASEWTGLFANKQTQTKNKTWKGTQYNILSTQSTYTSQWHCKEQLTAQSFRTTGGFLRLTSSIAKKLVLFQSHFWGKKLQKHGEEVETRNDPLKTDTFLCVVCWKSGLLPCGYVTSPHTRASYICRVDFLATSNNFSVGKGGFCRTYLQSE